MAARAASVKRYVVRLSPEERRRLEAMIHAGACVFWRARWSSLASSRPPATQRSSACHSSRTRRKYRIISPKARGAFVAAMEDVLSVYTRPRDPNRPLVCLDETSKRLVAETRLPIAMKPGQAARIDCEYTCNGVANLFMTFAPLEGWRRVKVADWRTAGDYASVLKYLADVHFAQAAPIVLLQDNLNTHAAASLYQAFPAAEARRLVERFEWRYTPKHGSWLNLAESALGVLASRCLDRRIPDKQTIADEVAASVARRNADHATADWRFTTEDARAKLKNLYALL
jgi:hypothetical protein